MLFLILFGLISGHIGLCMGQTLPSDSFKEEMIMRPLKNGDLLAHFRFTTLTSEINRDFHLFPLSMGELVQKFNLLELDLSLARGVWREGIFGAYAPESVPPGAKLLAWFKEDSKDIDDLWKGLTNAMSGQFCASLNFLDSQNTVSPKFSYAPVGVVDSDTKLNTSFLRVGHLPGEIVCTENLSPLKKLLPCGPKKGLSTLLRAKNIHRTKYHAIGLKLRNICLDKKCSEPLTELTQTVTLVFAQKMNIENDSEELSWSLRSVFGLGLNSNCPLADESKIYIENSTHSLTIKNQQHLSNLIEKDGRNFVVFDTKKLVESGTFNIVVNQVRKKESLLSKKGPTLQATRFITGYGQEEGTIVTKILNLSKMQPINVVFLDVLPWYTPIYFHTLTITQNKKEIEAKSYNFIPGIYRKRPYSIELVLTLPPKSETLISIDFIKSILKWTEYPPDANHGFYIGPATISGVIENPNNYTGVPRHFSDYESYLKSHTHGHDGLIHIYTETLLVNLPTPDFSMPYNVICLTCTVVALAFGPLHNITTKRLVAENIDRSRPSFWKRILGRIPGLGRRQAAENE